MCLSRHITHLHKITTRAYYDTYVKQVNEGLCKFCNGGVTFNSIGQGYAMACKNCYSLIAKEKRNKLRNDLVKFETFKQKVSENQKNIWKKRRLKKHKPYGWWKTQSIEQKQRIQLKIIMTTLGLSEKDIQITFPYNPEEFKNYRNDVNTYTRKTYNLFRNNIDPKNLRGSNWQLDHKFSVKAGFLLDIPPSLIAHYTNLEIIPRRNNAVKNMRCSVSQITMLTNAFKNILGWNI
jgi:hypothetical protein